MRERALLVIFLLSGVHFGWCQDQPSRRVDRLALLSEFIKAEYSSFDPVKPNASIDSDIKIGGLPSSGSILFWQGAYCSSPHLKPPTAVPSVLNPLSSTQSNVAGPRPWYPVCGSENLTAQLSITFDFEWTQGRWWIKSIDAGGDYLLKAVVDLEKSFHENFVRSKEAGIQRFHEQGAEFGPDKKKEFLASIDVERFFDLTGCRLDLTKVEFQKSPQDEEIADPHTTRYLGHLRWIVYGIRSGKVSCKAEFEPMHGRLTRLMDTFVH